jgi:hypothetical protein
MFPKKQICGFSRESLIEYCLNQKCMETITLNNSSSVVPSERQRYAFERPKRQMSIF